MIKKIKRVNPLQLGKIAAVFYGIFSLLLIPITIILDILAKKPAPKLTYILIMPVLYIVMSFIMAIVTATIYNLCAKWLGGVEVEIED